MRQAADDDPPRQDLTTLESYQAAIISSFLADKRWKCVFSSILCMIVSRCSPAGESQFTSFPPTSKSQLTPRWKAVSPTSCGWKFQICCTCDHPLQQNVCSITSISATLQQHFNCWRRLVLSDSCQELQKKKKEKSLEGSVVEYFSKYDSASLVGCCFETSFSFSCLPQVSLSLSASVASLQKALSQIIYSVNNVDHPVWRFVHKLHFVL